MKYFVLCFVIIFSVILRINGEIIKKPNITISYNEHKIQNERKIIDLESQKLLGYLYNAIFWDKHTIEIILVLYQWKIIRKIHKRCVLSNNDNDKRIDGELKCIENHYGDIISMFWSKTMYCYCTFDTDIEYKNNYIVSVTVDDEIFYPVPVSYNYLDETKISLCSTVLLTELNFYDIPLNDLMNTYLEYYINQGISEFYFYTLNGMLKGYNINDIIIFNNNYNNININIYDLTAIENDPALKRQGFTLYLKYQKLILADCQLRTKTSSKYTIFSGLDEYFVLNNKGTDMDLKRYLLSNIDAPIYNIGVTGCVMDKTYCNKYDYQCNVLNKKEDAKFLENMRYSYENCYEKEKVNTLKDVYYMDERRFNIVKGVSVNMNKNHKFWIVLTEFGRDYNTYASIYKANENTSILLDKENMLLFRYPLVWPRERRGKHKGSDICEHISTKDGNNMFDRDELTHNQMKLFYQKKYGTSKDKC